MGFKTTRRFVGKGSKIFIAVFFFLGLIWNNSSMKTRRIYTYELNNNKSDTFYHIQKNKVQNNLEEIKFKGNGSIGNDNSYMNKELTNDKITVDELLSTGSSKISFIEREMDKLNTEKVPADDPRLVKLIRNYFIKPPSKLPYNLLDMKKLDTSMGQAAFVDNRMGFKENGFFVEGGAHDGEYLSNTLFLERIRNWTGILIEPQPDSFRALRQKHRKAYTINACLSLYPYPSMEYLSTIPVIGRIEQKNQSSQRYDQEAKIRVQCFPLYSILLALNKMQVDFLSLDVEGVERQVLDAIPWNKVNITMLSVEFDKWPGGKKSLCKYMKSKGYGCSVALQAPGAADILFRKRYMR